MLSNEGFISYTLCLKESFTSSIRIAYKHKRIIFARNARKFLNLGTALN